MVNNALHKSYPSPANQVNCCVALIYSLECMGDLIAHSKENLQQTVLNFQTVKND